MITEQRKLFIDEYLKLRCKNAKQAAINAGYSPKSAQSQSSQLLKDSKVLEYLESRKNEIAKELRQEFLFDALEAREVMYKIMNDEETSDREKITVAKDFLDRAGFKPTEKLEVDAEIQHTNPYDGLTVDELKALARKCENG